MNGARLHHLLAFVSLLLGLHVSMKEPQSKSDQVQYKDRSDTTKVWSALSRSAGKMEKQLSLRQQLQSYVVITLLAHEPNGRFEQSFPLTAFWTFRCSLCTAGYDI